MHVYARLLAGIVESWNRDKAYCHRQYSLRQEPTGAAKFHFLSDHAPEEK